MNQELRALGLPPLVPPQIYDTTTGEDVDTDLTH